MKLSNDVKKIINTSKLNITKRLWASSNDNKYTFNKRCFFDVAIYSFTLPVTEMTLLATPTLGNNSYE